MFAKGVLPKMQVGGKVGLCPSLSLSLPLSLSLSLSFFLFFFFHQKNVQSFVKELYTKYVHSYTPRLTNAATSTPSTAIRTHALMHGHLHMNKQDKDTTRTLPNLQMSSPVFIGAVAYKPRPKTGSVRISYGTGIEAPVSSGLRQTSFLGGSRT